MNSTQSIFPILFGPSQGLVLLIISCFAKSSATPLGRRAEGCLIFVNVEVTYYYCNLSINYEADTSARLELLSYLKQQQALNYYHIVEIHNFYF
mmetsp:Transcript_8039/g.13694  ORF Transcript_8039/g.13694 Transcript_8039/m.13694 type:complete len:94 (+) Transcript_8039:993-1274(+)